MSPVVFELLIMLAVLIALTFLAVRHRLAFRIGTRNAFRARTRTILLVLGLLVATTIVSGSLIVGDTVSHVATHYTVLAVGYNDELVGNQSPSGAYTQFPHSVYTNLTSRKAGDHEISATASEVVGSVTAFDQTSKVPKPGLYLIGANANQSSQLGNFVTDSGSTLSGPVPGEVLIDDLAASEPNASAGDSVLLYGAGPTPTTSILQAIVRDNMRAAFPTGLGNFGTVFVSLSQAQQIENFSTSINVISVTNVGDQASRLSVAPAVSGLLNSTLTSIPGAQGLYAQQLLVTSLARATSDGSGVTTLFFALGLFAIVAGVVLIIGIFVLLTEERKGEMGIIRAIGLRGRELVYSYLFEGTIYSAGGALAGTFAGIGIGYVLINAAIILNLVPTLPSAAILQSFTVTTQTLITAYVVGFFITLGTVVLAGVRSSRINIVRAIRDIPEPPPALRTYTSLAILGIASLILGALLYTTTYSGTSDLSYPITGGALAVAGAASSHRDLSVTGSRSA
jgi:putative ABC transport system permease protein